MTTASMRNFARRRRARREIRRLRDAGRGIARGFVPHAGWLWHAPGDHLLALLRQGYFEAQEQAFAWLYLRPGDWILDCGAHVGLYSVLAARATRGAARVLSVEANPGTADLLEANLDENGVLGAVVRGAVWSSCGTVRFERERPDRAAYAHVSFATAPDAVQVASTTIDHLVEQNGIPRVALVKLDVEGAEPEAIAGAASALARGACPLWMIEFTEANLQGRGWTTVRLGELVRGNGLLPCELDEESLTLRPISTAEPIWFKNVLAVQDLDRANDRLRAAPARNVEVARDILARARACSRFQELEELDRLRALAVVAEENEAWARRTEAALAEERRLTAALRNRADGPDRRGSPEVDRGRVIAEANARSAPRPDASAARERATSETGAAAAAGGAPAKLDVCLCTHDPRREVLSLAIRSLARQSAGPGAFRVVLVDNASSPPVGDEVLAPLREAGIDAVLTREEQRGLTQARLHAIHRTAARWMLFVDDDNELADDFIAEGLAFIASRSDVGCFGGKLQLPESVRPPRWALPYLPFLGIKDAGDEVITGAADQWGPWEPAGAGFWIRRDQLEAYRARIERDARSLRLGRNGRNGLASCEDSLMAREGLKLGLLNAYVPRLTLRHHLDPARFRIGYVLRLMRAYGSSHVLLESILRADAPGAVRTPDRYRGRRFLRVLASEFNSGRKQSFPFAMGKVMYHWSSRAAYRRHERGD